MPCLGVSLCVRPNVVYVTLQVQGCIFERASVRLCLIVYVRVRVKECVGACKCIMCFCWYENVYD